MAAIEEADQRSVSESVSESVSDAVGQQSYETLGRNASDALLDISIEAFLKELEPHKYHCYSGWEEAARGWDRVAPRSCILLAHKSRKPMRKANDAAPLSIDPTLPNADSPTSRKKSMQSNQHTGSRSNTAVAALQKDTSQWHDLNALPMAMSNLRLEENVEEEGTFRETPRQSRSPELQKLSHRPSNTVVPIKHFTFLPPVETPHLNPQRRRCQLYSCKNAPEGETMKEKFSIFDKKSGVRRTRVDPVINPALPAFSAGLTYKSQICRHSPHLFSAISVPIPNPKVSSACVYQT